MTTYAVHVSDGGTSEYPGYSFNSVCELNGVLYALKSDGLFSLNGNSDAGVEIASNIGLGYDEAEMLGNLSNVYIEANTEDKLLVVVPAAQGVFEYPTRRSSEDQRIQRADTGKGLRENKYYVFIRNIAGAAFTVFNVTLKRSKGTRRI